MADTTSKEADLVTDVIAPCILIASLIIGNGFLFAFIMRQRKKMPPIDEVPDLGAGGDAPNENEIELEPL